MCNYGWLYLYPDLSSGLVVVLGGWRGDWAQGWVWILLREWDSRGMAELQEGMEWGQKVSHPSQIHILHPQLWSVLAFSCPQRDEDGVLVGSLNAQRLLLPPPGREVSGFTVEQLQLQRESGDESEHYSEDVTADVFTATPLPRCS